MDEHERRCEGADPGTTSDMEFPCEAVDTEEIIIEGLPYELCPRHAAQVAAPVAAWPAADPVTVPF